MLKRLLDHNLQSMFVDPTQVAAIQHNPHPYGTAHKKTLSSIILGSGHELIVCGNVDEVKGELGL